MFYSLLGARACGHIPTPRPSRLNDKDPNFCCRRKTLRTSFFVVVFDGGAWRKDVKINSLCESLHLIRLQHCCADDWVRNVFSSNFLAAMTRHLLLAADVWEKILCFR